MSTFELRFLVGANVGVQSVRDVLGYPATLDSLAVTPFIGVLRLLQLVPAQVSQKHQDTHLPRPINEALHGLPNLHLHLPVPGSRISRHRLSNQQSLTFSEIACTKR
jgi:hypothetical protein